MKGGPISAVEHFQDPRVAAVAPLAIDLNHRDRILAAGIQYTPAGRIRLCQRGCAVAALAAKAAPVLSPYPAAAFYRKKILEPLGGFSCDAGDRLAMLDLGLTLKHLGFYTVFEPRSTVAASPEHQPRDQCVPGRAGTRAILLAVGTAGERLFSGNAPACRGRRVHLGACEPDDFRASGRSAGRNGVARQQSAAGTSPPVA